MPYLKYNLYCKILYKLYRKRDLHDSYIAIKYNLFFITIGITYSFILYKE